MINKTDHCVNLTRIRETVLRSSFASGHGHIPTSFSVVELIAATYSHMQHNPDQPDWSDRDIFVLSKGHAALGYYCVLAEFGYFKRKEVETFGAVNSRLGCHPDRQKVPGVEVSCGSLGHGIGIAVGMALGLKIRKSRRRVYVLIGDGESNEGSVWEAVMVAAGQKLDNLTILYDDNRSQKRCLQINEPTKVFSALGCQTIDVDGHDIEEITAAMKSTQNTVKCIIGRTTKGYKCQTLVDKVYEWHRRSPKEDELNKLLEELHA